MRQQPDNAFEKHLQKVKIKYVKGPVVLEIGCGDCSVFKDTKFIADGYDIDGEVIEKCSSYRKVSTNLDDFDITSYDSLCLLGVLEHMEETKIGELLPKLKDAKNIYITVPNGSSFHRLIGLNLGIIKDTRELSEHDYKIGHKRYYDIISLVALLHPFTKQYNFSMDFIGTEGFKFDTSECMIHYLDRIEAIEDSARKCNLIGRFAYRGAEAVINLRKNG